MSAASAAVKLQPLHHDLPVKATASPQLTRICTNGLNRRARSASAMPAPVSVTDTRQAIARFARVLEPAALPAADSCSCNPESPRLRLRRARLPRLPVLRRDAAMA